MSGPFLEGVSQASGESGLSDCHLHSWQRLKGMTLGRPRNSSLAEGITLRYQDMIIHLSLLSQMLLIFPQIQAQKKSTVV